MLTLLVVLVRFVSTVASAATMGLLIVGLIGFFTFGGAPKRYEIEAVGALYSGVLFDIEHSARDLRVQYCGEASPDGRLGAHCQSVSLAAEGVVEESPAHVSRRQN